MADSKYVEFLQFARYTALCMMNNAIYIQKELPNVFVEDDLRGRVGVICESLIGTKHDVMHEIFEYSPEQGESTVFGERILNWLFDPMAEMHPIIMELQMLSKEDGRYGLAFLLVSESATNILNAFNQTKSSFDSWSAKESNAK